MDVSSAFPRYAESDWRKAAEAALKGGSLEALQSKTADGFALARRIGALEEELVAADTRMP